MSAEQEEFLSKYTTIMGKVWQDEAEERKLLANPKKYAIEAGLPVSPDAEVVLDRSQADGLFASAQLVDDWNSTPGRHILHVPAAPLVDLSELDEKELETVAGGGASAEAPVVIIACYVST